MSAINEFMNKVDSVSFKTSTKRFMFNIEKLAQKYAIKEPSGLEIDLCTMDVFAPGNMKEQTVEKRLSKYERVCNAFSFAAISAPVVDKEDLESKKLTSKCKDLNKLFEAEVKSQVPCWELAIPQPKKINTIGASNNAEKHMYRKIKEVEVTAPWPQISEFLKQQGLGFNEANSNTRRNITPPMKNLNYVKSSRELPWNNRLSVEKSDWVVEDDVIAGKAVGTNQHGHRRNPLLLDEDFEEMSLDDCLKGETCSSVYDESMSLDDVLRSMKEKKEPAVTQSFTHDLSSRSEEAEIFMGIVVDRQGSGTDTLSEKSPGVVALKLPSATPSSHKTLKKASNSSRRRKTTPVKTPVCLVVSSPMNTQLSARAERALRRSARSCERQREMLSIGWYGQEVMHTKHSSPVNKKSSPKKMTKSTLVMSSKQFPVADSYQKPAVSVTLSKKKHSIAPTVVTPKRAQNTASLPSSVTPTSTRVKSCSKANSMQKRRGREMRSNESLIMSSLETNSPYTTMNSKKRSTSRSAFVSRKKASSFSSRIGLEYSPQVVPSSVNRKRTSRGNLKNKDRSVETEKATSIGALPAKKCLSWSSTCTKKKSTGSFKGQTDIQKRRSSLPVQIVNTLMSEPQKHFHEDTPEEMKDDSPIYSPTSRSQLSMRSLNVSPWMNGEFRAPVCTQDKTQWIEDAKKRIQSGDFERDRNSDNIEGQARRLAAGIKRKAKFEKEGYF